MATSLNWLDGTDWHDHADKRACKRSDCGGEFAVLRGDGVCRYAGRESRLLRRIFGLVDSPRRGQVRGKSERQDAVEVLGTATRYKIELEKKGLNTIEVRSCDGDGTWSEWEPIEVEAWEVKLMYNMEGYESYLTLYRAQNDPLNLPYGEDVELVGYDFDYWMGESSGVAVHRDKARNGRRI